MPNVLGYGCTAGGDLVGTTSGFCVCTAPDAVAPAVSAPQSFAVTVTASAGKNISPGAGTASVLVQPAVVGRGCTDDESVPVILEVDFATTPSFGSINDAKPFVFSTIGDGIEDPPSVAAVRLRVIEGGGGWTDGVFQIGPYAGSSAAEAVISRCRGRFDAGGRVHIVRLEGYKGPENQSPQTFFPAWWVDPVSQPGIFTAILNAPGRKAHDGWISDGIYYVNLRQTFCSAGKGGTCTRSIAGTGVPLMH